MSGRFVRASKFRHVYGKSTKREQCFDNLRISKNAWDTNLIKANPSYISVNWEASGGGAFAVIPVNERGKLPEQLPLFRGHTSAVLDTDWNPFDDSFIASASDDGKVLLWRVPEDFSIHQDPENIVDVKPVSKLQGHSRKVGHVLFNPAANNVLASSSGDYSIKLWDTVAETSSLTLKHNDIVQSLSWKGDGSLLVTTCRDKKLRVWDARQQKPILETPGHSGAKNSRAVFLGDKDRIATTGFSKMSDRQLALWSLHGREPIDGFQMLDQISGVCMPFWDEGTQCLYLAGKGDGNIRYYEFDNDKFEYLSQHSAAEPQRGIAFLPKRGVDTHENEVMRAFRTVNDSFVEPVSFIVPRRAEVFQDDIYPPTIGTKPGLSASEWFEGKTALPPKISLESVYEGQVPAEVPADEALPVPAKAVEPIPVHKLPEPEPEATPVMRGPVASMKDNQTSIANMASKFADKNDEDAPSESETSSFEEVPEPVNRSKTNGAASGMELPKTASVVATSTTVAEERKTLPSPAKEASPPRTEPNISNPTHRSTSSTGSATGSAADNLKSHLQGIKDLLVAQNEKIDSLARDIQLLKGMVTDGSKDERIRSLELEVEQLRS